MLTLLRRIASFDLASSIQHNTAIGHYAVAVSLDVEKLYDRVSPSTTVTALYAVGLRSGVMQFLEI